MVLARNRAFSTAYRYGLRILVFIGVLAILRSYLLCSPYICRPWLRSSHTSLGSQFSSASDGVKCRQSHISLNDSMPKGSVAMVVATIESDDVSWMWDNFHKWKILRYIMDNPSLNTTLPANKGSESMAYLTYIIDNYNDLPDIIIFSHGSRYQWHNDDPMYDGVNVLQNLQLSSVSELGYVNLRCTWQLGCPNGLRPHRLLPTIEAFFEPNNDRANMEASFAHAFREVFDTDAPNVIAVPCCAQFAVSKEQLRKRTLCEYISYREWLLQTPLPDSVSGRIMEYSWHIIMGMPPVYCPEAKVCFCESFGLCNLECDTRGSCRGRYWQPPKYTIPERWPETGQGTHGLPEWGWWETTRS